MSGSMSWWNTVPLDQYYQRLLKQHGYNRKGFRPPAFRDAHQPVQLLVQTSASPNELTTKPEAPALATKPKPEAPSPATKPEVPAPATKPQPKPKPETPTSASQPQPEEPALAIKPKGEASAPATKPPLLHFHIAYAPNYHFIMDNADACKNHPFLVLMVPVAPTNVDARDAICQTWGKESRVQGEQVLTLFMLGLAKGPQAEQQSLQQENDQHHDLIQNDFVDSYVNLTIKTMVIMHWLSMHCTNAVFAMKIDSDMFLNIDNLVDMLKKPEIPRVNYLTGMLMVNRPVVRSKNSKWYVSEEMYPEHTYPTYCLGMGYIFSSDLPTKFVEVSKTIKPFNIEDAYIGMCMTKLGLSPTSPPQPWQFQAYNSKYNRCQFSRVITYILHSSQQLLQFWTDLKKSGPPCPE
ncbi:beta-1,3-galactosyltransferase 1-like [Boleophthalmus pectinirostris]|uniref:beta-1,3-galactosyltransferase 1-like n=1 Tax=Boleophthalmus pectinirostris TaxID=150288 RepID=UPI00243273F1|nr:beta-1,3-galactosyltransferase 1-like [Boleophthalmus pectinirostris]